ncbi:hypothetical protein DFH11DRAFT_1545689 [Phellopilus nigrolimitatus]|nr:hypothetical protein DFH11DRAFT_1545689 [Phellopilus nigrolimitatus]
MTSTINVVRDTQNNHTVINQYLIGHRLGNGQHGEVYKGFDIRRENLIVAIKACKRKNPKEAKQEQLRQRNQGAIPRSNGGFGTRPRLVDQLQNTEKKVLREIAIMKKCKHGQIVQLYEVINDRLMSKILLVMEYMGGGEVKWRDSNGRPCLRVDQTRRICRDVVLGLEYLHHQGIVHRDIKPANLLWTADRKNVKITDFGVSHFSAAQRIDALRHSNAYREALERRKKDRRKKEQETPRKRMGGWRGKGSRDEIKEKGKGRAQDESAAASTSVLVSSVASASLPPPEDAAVEAEVLASLVGSLDPILLDDGGLSRQAGTPSFLAPEIIWEFGAERTAALMKKMGAGRSSEAEQTGNEGASTRKATTRLTPRPPGNLPPEEAPDRENVHLGETQSTIPDPDPSSFLDPNVAAAAAADEDSDASWPARPPITKAIDVWALGVTLFCLLFGRTPWSGGTEFAMYHMIHTEDFLVDGTMGLLERLLEKDCSKRITLDEVKSLPWITRDIPNPEAWLAETSPCLHDPIDVTSADEDVAMSTVKFRWERLRKYIPAVPFKHKKQYANADANRSFADPEEVAKRPSPSRKARLQRRPSRGRRVVDAVDRGVKSGVKKIASNIYGGADTPRSMKRRTLPDLVMDGIVREHSLSRSCGSRSRPASRASGKATPRAMSGSRSNLTSPSTAGFTSDGDGDIDILDEDDERAVYERQALEESQASQEWEKEHKARARATCAPLALADLQLAPARVAHEPRRGQQRREQRPEEQARHGVAREQLRALELRDAAPRAAERGRVWQRARGARRQHGARPGGRHGSGLALKSADELTSAMRAASWGDVGEEYGFDYGYGANLYGEIEDGGSEYGDYGYGYEYGYGSGYGYGYGEADDATDEVRLVGAGGMLSHPVSGPSSPNSLSGVSVGPNGQVPPLDGLTLHSVVREASAGAVVAGPPTLPLLQTAGALAADTAGGLDHAARRRGGSVSRQQAQHREREREHAHHHQISSPLAQTPINLDLELESDEARASAVLFDEAYVRLRTRDADEFDDADADADADGASAGSGERVYGRGATSLTVDMEDDDDGEEEDDEEDDDDDEMSSEEEEAQRIENGGPFPSSGSQKFPHLPYAIEELPVLHLTKAPSIYVFFLL